jgi:uncharacterized membrane protein
MFLWNNVNIHNLLSSLSWQVTCRWRITYNHKQNGLKLKVLTLVLISDLHSIIVPQHLQIFNQRSEKSVNIIPRMVWPGFKPYIIIYFRLLHNQEGRFKIINTIGQVLCVLLFMNGFMSSVLITILIFLGSFANSEFHESIFYHWVASAGCLIISASCLCFSLCHRNNSDSFLFANQLFKWGMIGKYQNIFLGIS